MNPIKEPTIVDTYKRLVAEMMLSGEYEESEFRPEWVRNHAWTVVPAEDANHLAPENIPVIVKALRDAGYLECIAVATEPVNSLPSCYRVSVTEDDFRAFNRECGLLRYLLTNEFRSWAISCNEWYLLFAGKRDLLQAMLGKSVEAAREEYLNFASALAKKPDEPLLKVLERYK